LFSPTPPLFDDPARGRTRWDFWMKLMTQRHGATVCENFIILTSTVLTDPPVLQTDRQTDGRAIAYSALSMYMLYARTGVWRAKNLWLHTGIEPQILKAKDVRQKLQINFTQAFNHLQSCLVSRRAREREWHILHHVLPVNVFICLDCFIINLWLHAGLSARSCRWPETMLHPCHRTETCTKSCHNSEIQKTSNFSLDRGNTLPCGLCPYSTL